MEEENGWEKDGKRDKIKLDFKALLTKVMRKPVQHN